MKVLCFGQIGVRHQAKKPVLPQPKEVTGGNTLYLKHPQTGKHLGGESDFDAARAARHISRFTRPAMLHARRRSCML
jgi:hypothetical protein